MEHILKNAELHGQGENPFHICAIILYIKIPNVNVMTLQ